MLLPSAEVSELKLPKAKLTLCVSDHFPESHKSKNGLKSKKKQISHENALNSIRWQSLLSTTNLCEYEYGENDVYTPLQRLNDKSFVEQLKQDDHKLKDGQQPKSSQFWHL